MHTALGSPIRANFEITDSCPLACEHCYTYWGFSATGVRNSKDRSGRSLADMEAVLDVIIASGVQVVTFTGGEPLVRKDLLFPLIARAKSNGMRVLVNTSATMLSAADADRMAELRVDGFLVSLMSSDEDENNLLAHANSYARTTRGIRMLADRGLVVTVNMVCSKANYGTVRETAQLATDLGAVMFSATPMLPTPGNMLANRLHLDPDELHDVMFDLLWARDNLPIQVTTLDPVVHCQFDSSDREQLGSLLGERYCCAGITDCAVSPNGDLRACIMTDQVAGNLLTDGWEKSWEALSPWREPTILPTACRECDLVDACGGGCRVAAQATTGDLSGRDPYMTLPIVGVSAGGAIRPQVPELEPRTFLTFHPDVVARPEPFGGSLFLRGKATFLKQGPFALTTGQQARGPFTPLDWAQEHELSIKSVLDFLSVLRADGFLIPVEGGERK
ncbi:MAG: radical SAM protein [Propionibacteriaceae bacterium]|nr:radical SAM protein [Propionibacteriaceae bacterium]